MNRCLEDATYTEGGVPSGSADHASSRSMRETGFLSVSYLVLLFVLSVAMTAGAHHWHGEYRQLQGHLIGKEMARLNDAVQDFVMRFPNEIKALSQPRTAYITLPSSGTFIPATLLEGEPSWKLNHASLNQITRLLGTKGVPDAKGYALRLHFSQSGASPRLSCVDGDVHLCSIETLLYREDGLFRYGRTPDHLKIQAALRTIGRGAAVSGARGHNGQIPNPIPNGPGILYVRGQLAPQDLPFLHVRHGRMEGSIDMQGHPIRNGTRLSLTGGLDITSSGITPLGGRRTLDIHSDSLGYHPAVGELPKEPTIKIKDRVINVGTIEASTIITPYLIAPKIASDRTACTDDTLAISPEHKLVYCQNNRWQTLNGRDGKRHGRSGGQGAQGPLGDYGADYDA